MVGIGTVAGKALIYGKAQHGGSDGAPSAIGQGQGGKVLSVPGGGGHRRRLVELG